ncbi:MAG: FIST N-terminal domain-containing protein [Burkholderiaceae bacterium]
MTERTPLPYLVGHATHEDPATAIELAIARIDGGGLTGASRGMLGLAYATEATGIRPPALADLLRRRLPDVHWVGAVAHGVYAGDVEYTDAPAVALMIVPLDPASWTLFSDDRQDDREMSGVLVHASPGTSDVEARIGQLRDGVDPGPLFGGITAATGPRGSHFAGAPVAGGCGMSGVAFGDSAGLLSAVTQGCAVLSSKHVISACSSNYIHSLDGSPALDVLLEDLGVPESTRRSRDGDEILRALPSRRLRRGLLLGIVDGDTSPLGRNGTAFATSSASTP